MFGRSEDLDLAVRILHRLAERGGTHFLAIGWAEAARRVAELCRQAGDDALADQVEQPLRDSADWFVSQGVELVSRRIFRRRSPIISSSTNALMPSSVLAARAACT